ncbi:MAG TPA: cupin-like domain-containing protein [Myxococcales bacterium]|nr:cupin-like domain-containing protein [Myxococcales bacterium]
MAENLGLGVGAARLEAALRKAGVPRARAAAEVRAIQEHPAVAEARRLCRAHGELLALLDTRSQLFRRLGSRRLEKRADLSPREFIEDYYLAHRPVVLQGLTDDWPARERWRPERLAERFGHVKVQVMLGRESDPEYDVFPDAHRKWMRLGDFIRLVLRTSPSNDCYLTARNDVMKRMGLHALLEDVRVPGGFIAHWERPGNLRLWIGPAGTRTSLHHDLNSLLSVQVIGRKHFWLVPSYEHHRVANTRGVWGSVDADHPDLGRYPAYREANAVQTTLEEGEALFLPMGWYHQVRALEVSVSLTFDRFEVPGQNTVWAMPG